MPKTALAPNAMSVLFDSSVSPLPSRFGGAVNDRHLVFVGQDFDMHLKISVAEGNKELRGQVIPHVVKKDLQSATITLLAEGEPVGKSTTDESGEFNLREIPTGDLVVEVMTANRRVKASFSL
jgi:hypothetical protein